MRIAAFGASLVVAALSAGAGYAETTVRQLDIDAALAHCDKPVASIFIGRFTCKAEACSTAAAPAAGPAGFAALMAMAQAAQGISVEHFPQLGDSMSAAMTTALKATGCFDVQEREALDDLRREAELEGVELKAKPADYMVSGAITSVGLETRSSNVGGGLLPFVGAISKSTRHATLGLDVRLVDVKQATVRDARSFSADNTRSNWGVGGLGYGGSGALFGTSQTTRSPEMDTVANEAVINAANFVAETIAGAAITRQPARAMASK